MEVVTETVETETVRQPDRCIICDWPYATSADKGCFPGNCAFRAHGAEWDRIKERRALLDRFARELHVPTSDGAPPSRMVQIDRFISELQEISRRFGNTCVYIRRFGLSWGATALNYHADDEKNGVFDQQKRYEDLLIQRAEQVERLIKHNQELLAEVGALKAELGR